MRFVLDRFPIAAPLQTEIGTHCADRFVLWRFIQIFAPFEHANVECDAEIVVRISAARVGDDLAGLGPALRVKIVLLFIRAQTANYLDPDSGRGRFENKRPGARLYFRQERRDDFLAPIIHLFAQRWTRALVWTDPIVNRYPSLRCGIAVDVDA